jgi:ABC-2 type transport system ATP-binding protein
MLAIRAENLFKIYKSSLKREGIWGGFQDLISRNYREIVAVDNINLDVRQGEFLGYIGPNGAGKSTSIKMLTGILQPTSGIIEVLGYNPCNERKQFAKEIGVVFGQRTQLWWDIAVKESFELLRRIYEIPKNTFDTRIDYLIKFFAIEEHLHIPVRKLSLGERMKCDLIASLIHEPKILFLDEPTIGLDAIAKKAIRGMLKSLHLETGTTILLTTHDLREIEELCERIVVLDKGHIVYDGDIESVKNRVHLSRILKLELEQKITEPQRKIFNALNGIEKITEEEKTLEIVFDSKLVSVLEILGRISEDIKIRDISIIEPGIEEVITKIYQDGFKS